MCCGRRISQLFASLIITSFTVISAECFVLPSDISAADGLFEVQNYTGLVVPEVGDDGGDPRGYSE